jgi:hypothetical protein
MYSSMHPSFPSYFLCAWPRLGSFSI